MSTLNISITELAGNKAPFEEDYGVVSDDYIAIDDILGKRFAICAVKAFENDKGKGAYALVQVDGEFRYICTHSVGLVGKLTDDKVMETLDRGNAVDATIIKRKSKTSDRLVYAFA